MKQGYKWFIISLGLSFCMLGIARYNSVEIPTEFIISYAATGYLLTIGSIVENVFESEKCKFYTKFANFIYFLAALFLIAGPFTISNVTSEFNDFLTLTGLGLSLAAIGALLIKKTNKLIIKSSSDDKANRNQYGISSKYIAVLKLLKEAKVKTIGKEDFKTLKKIERIETDLTTIDLDSFESFSQLIKCEYDLYRILEISNRIINPRVYVYVAFAIPVIFVMIKMIVASNYNDRVNEFFYIINGMMIGVLGSVIYFFVEIIKKHNRSEHRVILAILIPSVIWALFVNSVKNFEFSAVNLLFFIGGYSFEVILLLLNKIVEKTKETIDKI